MNIDVAVEILRSMAQGVNPLSDEELPYDSVCNEVEVVRALYCVIEELESTGIVTKKKLRRPRKARSREEKKQNDKEPSITKRVYSSNQKHSFWSLEEDDDLCRMYDEGYTIKNMQEYFGRDKNEIIFRLKILDKFDFEK